MPNEWGRGSYGQRGSAVEQILAEMADKARAREEQQKQETFAREQAARQDALAQREMQNRVYASLIGNTGDPRAWEIARMQGLQLPEFRQLPAEQARDLSSKDAIGYFGDPSGMAPGFRAMNAFQVGTGAAAPPHLQASAVNQDLYTRQNMPPQMVEGADIASGRRMSEKEAADARQDALRTAAQTAANFALARQRSAATGSGQPGTSPAITANPNAPTGDAFLKTLDPFTAGLVKKIADYEVDLTKAASMRGGSKGADSERLRLLKLVAQYDPTYDMTQYASRSATRTDFTKGKAALNMRSLNTLVKHIGSLDAAGKKLDNTGLPPVNWIVNATKRTFGSGAPTRFGMAAIAVESEMASLFKGMGATDQEIKAWREQISEDMSPEQLQVVKDTAIDLLGGRLAALSDQWQGSMGKPRDFKILTEQSRKTLKGMGINPDELDAGISAGGAGAATGDAKQLDDATARQFLKQAGGDKDKARALAKAAGYVF